MNFTFKPVKLSVLVFSTFLIFNSLAETVKEKPVDKDYLKLLDTFKNYTQAADVAAVSKVSSSFYNSDEKTMAELQAKADATLKEYLSNSNVKQSGATQVLIKTLNDAYAALKQKLEIQKAAVEAFDKASKQAVDLDKAEKAQETKCKNGLSSALAAGVSVNNICNDLKNDDDKKACGDELGACTQKINSDLEKFTTYLIKREKKMGSKAGFDLVSADADYITANFPGSSQVCNNYSKQMASNELAGNCLDKISKDEKNESYQNPPKEIENLNINEDLDSNMLIPKNRIEVWGKFKQMAEDKVKATLEAMSRVKENIEKLGGSIIDLDNGLGGSSAEVDDFDVLAIRTNGGTSISLGLIKQYFAKNPSPEDILRDAAGLGLTKFEIAHAMNLAGYGGAKPSDLNNYAETQAAEGKFISKIDQFVSSKGANFDGPRGSLQVPGVTPVDATKNVMSNKGWITPPLVKEFLDTKPTDQQFFEKMTDLKLRTSDIGSILNGQGLLFKNGDPREALLNDKDFGSIFNRLQCELYQGTTGYGVVDTYDPFSLITKGTGHISDEENKTWVPYGFKSAPNQHVYTDNQAPVPTSFISGGKFGGTSKAINTTKVISKEVLKKLLTK